MCDGSNITRPTAIEGIEIPISDHRSGAIRLAAACRKDVPGAERRLASTGRGRLLEDSR